MGDLIAVNAYILHIWSPLMNLAKSYRGIVRSSSEVEKIFELMEHRLGK